MPPEDGRVAGAGLGISAEDERLLAVGPCMLPEEGRRGGGGCEGDVDTPSACKAALYARQQLGQRHSTT